MSSPIVLICNNSNLICTIKATIKKISNCNLKISKSVSITLIKKFNACYKKKTYEKNN